MSAAIDVRNRTDEWRAVVERLQMGKAAGPGPQSSSSHYTRGERSQFASTAAAAAAGLTRAAARTARLSALAARPAGGAFDDTASEFDEISGAVKRDLQELTAAIGALAPLGSTSNRSGAGSDAAAHAAAVVDALKTRLKDAAEEFKRALAARAEAERAAAARRAALFSVAPPPAAGAAVAAAPWPAVAAATAAAPGLTAAAVAAPPPTFGGGGGPFGGGASGGYGYGGEQAPLLLARDGSAGRTASSLFGGGGHIRQRRADGAMNGGGGGAAAAAGTGGPPGAPPQQYQQQMFLQQPQQQQQYNAHASARAETLRGVEATILELGGMFTQLAEMVTTQAEAAMRIDDNLADALGSADAARGELARYLRRITSNRGLMVKVLVVIMVCVAAFVLFVA